MTPPVNTSTPLSAPLFTKEDEKILMEMSPKEYKAVMELAMKYFERESQARLERKAAHLFK